MRSSSRCLVLIAAMYGGLTAAAREYVVRGVEDPRPDLLARALANDDGLLLLTSPLATRKGYLAAVAARAAAALQRSGHPDATATATVEAEVDGGRVAVDVVPGPGFTAAGIEITGLPDDLAADLQSWLKSQRPPPDAVPQAVDADGGWSGVRWVDHRGQPATLEPPLWSRGQPAAFDAHHLRELRGAIARFLRDHGQFAAARAVEKPASTGPRCDVSLVRGAGEATLAVAFTDLPPPAVLREIELAPASRTTTAALGNLLGVTVGAAVTEHDRLSWQETLRATGRFVRHEVKFKELKPGPDGAAGILAIFDLDAYPPVPPLGDPLSREEEAILRCRSWLLTTLADDDDLVATWTRSGAPAPTGALTISTREGILVTALPGGAEACGIAASGGGLGCFLPRGDGRLEIPVPVRLRAVIDVACTLRDVVEQGRHRCRGAFTCGARLAPRPREAAAAVALTARIEPVFCLALLHERSSTASWDGDVLTIDTEAARLRIDAASGRLLDIRFPDGDRIDIEAGPGRLAAALETLRGSAGADAWHDDAPVSSTIRFLTSDTLGSAADRLATATGLHPWLADALPPVAAVARNVRETVDRGGFAVADRRVAEALARAAEDDASALPAIPAAERFAAADDPVMAVAAAGAAQAWRWLDRACGGTAWPSGLIRIATLAARHDSTGALWEVTAFLATTSHGPLAHLAAASVIPIPSMAISFARQGQTRLSTAAFHADSAAILAALDDCGLDHCAASLLRSLDDDEARAAGTAWLHDSEALLPMVRELRACSSEEAAVAALPAALDRWWDASLRDVVAAALAARSGVQTADKPDAEATPRR